MPPSPFQNTQCRNVPKMTSERSRIPCLSAAAAEGTGKKQQEGRAMATLDRKVPSPEAFLGKPWSSWIDAAKLHCSDNVDLEEAGKEGGKSREVMRLNKEDSSDTYPSLELKTPKMSPDIAQGPGDGMAEYQVTLIENHRCKVRLESFGDAHFYASPASPSQLPPSLQGLLCGSPPFSLLTPLAYCIGQPLTASQAAQPVPPVDPVLLAVPIMHFSPYIVHFLAIPLVT
ncbi:hypothetical protein J1605_013311 [Eschrichtius robustus]|uniref:Ataxin-7-like protein 1 n=1 Tax=Eschrichtius robustus TaxID=9764 RepID=A0AB34GG59_ESCRO|nr:hypothetical protein J1605_013311 [Eschrichtius robustus]